MITITIIAVIIAWGAGFGMSLGKTGPASNFTNETKIKKWWWHETPSN